MRPCKASSRNDRIFSLVESDLLRRRASDLRDVATRLLRNIEGGQVREGEAPNGPYILAARKLTTADMFNLDNEQVEGIVAEEGMSSHAAILARGMGIPTLTGIRDLAKHLRDGDLAVLRATDGQLVVGPTDTALAEATTEAQRWRASQADDGEGAELATHQTRDGTAMHILGSCGSSGEADLVHTFGMEGVGVFRTELQFLASDARRRPRKTSSPVIGRSSTGSAASRSRSDCSTSRQRRDRRRRDAARAEPGDGAEGGARLARQARRLAAAAARPARCGRRRRRRRAGPFVPSRICSVSRLRSSRSASA